MVTIFFIYGLAFFVLGVSILIYPKKDSAFILSRTLWILGLYGIIHGINEWIDMFILLYRKYAFALHSIGIFFLSVSFLLLVKFAVSNIISVKKRYLGLSYLPWVLFILWLLVVYFAPDGFSYPEIWARYLLGTSGMYLTAYALMLQAGVFKKEKLSLVTLNLKVAASAFLLYGFFGGIIVPKAGFFPASLFNFESFRNIVGIPVQVFRAAAACVITYNMLKVLGVFHWEAKKVEEVLKSDREIFEKMVQDRSKQLLEAEKELDKARRLADMGMLAASIAHELRNPLAAIQIAAYNIKKKDVGALLEKHISNIEKKVAESDQIINNLLFYARLKSAHHERISIYDLLNECIDMAEKRFDGKNVVISRNFDSISGLVIDADPLQMRELFNNIFNNAFDAIAGKEGKIKIRAEQADAGHVAIYIKDNGIGIDEENLSKIYDPFFTTKSKGTGLGLTVASQIVYLHDGAMDIQSKKGEWAEVAVVLPVKKKEK